MKRLKFIDAHCHLVEPYFKNDELEKIIEEAQKHNVYRIINCASFPDTFEQCLESANLNSIDITLGLQPTLAKDITDANLIRDLFEIPESNKIKAIGEVGLDYHWIKESKERQRQELLFIDSIKLANEKSLPLVIHSRKAEMQCLDILEKYAEVKVLLHSFEGNLNAVNKAKDLGYLISIPTNVVIRKNRRKVVQRAELENIMIETDSPFCPPSEDIRPNTPMTIPIAARKIADLLEIEIEEVAKVTTNNVLRFHNL